MKPKAYGGVVINADRLILLREPKNHFDGYVWTFAKGRPEPGDSAEDTALREVREETGIVARIVAKIPGSFSGGTTDNEYFLMVPVDAANEFEDETQSVRWVTSNQAEQLIAKTTNALGNKRDLQVLKAAIATAKTLWPEPVPARITPPDDQ